jgi:hypothetical protein
MDHPVSGKALPAYGTAVLVNIVNEAGALPTKNFRGGRFEFAEDISGERMAELIQARGGKTKESCHPGCVIQCSQTYHDASGKYLTSGFEYETIWALGANTLIRHLDEIAMIDRLMVGGGSARPAVVPSFDAANAPSPGPGPPGGTTTSSVWVPCRPRSGGGAGGAGSGGIRYRVARTVTTTRAPAATNVVTTRPAVDMPPILSRLNPRPGRGGRSILPCHDEGRSPNDQWPIKQQTPNGNDQSKGKRQTAGGRRHAPCRLVFVF